MKVALLGKGKTGGKVAQLHQDEITIFDSTHPITPENLKGHDVVISFLPGHVFVEYLDVLADSKIPVVTGSTGFEFPSGFDQKLKDNKVAWIYAHNFSLGMNVVRVMIEQMALLKKLILDHKSSIHEVHHVHKKDSPSGTALHWNDWYGGDCEITAAREGDVVGFHEITFDSHTEKVTLAHEAKDRAIFAKGALWAAKLIHNNDDVSAGLNQFNNVVRKYLNI